MGPREIPSFLARIARDTVTADNSPSTYKFARTILSSHGNIVHHGTTMTEVASTDPVVSEAAIVDNEEDESKVCTPPPHPHTPH
jgi:hypothetical protein